MTDKREEVLTRLEAIAGEIEESDVTVQSVVRDELELDDSQLPAIAILEGDEETSTTTRRPPSAAMLVTMTPEVAIIVSTPRASMGTTFSTLRAALVKAILTDSALATLLGPHGRVAYQGMVSDLGLGRMMLGRMALRFTITYVLNPTKL